MEHRLPRAAETIAIPAGRFKDQVLNLVRRVARTGDEVVVTVRGVPMAKLVPASRRTGNRFVGAGRQTVRVTAGAEGLAALVGGASAGAAASVTGALPPAGNTDGGEPRRLSDGGVTPRQLHDGSVGTSRFPQLIATSGAVPVNDAEAEALLAEAEATLMDDEALALDGVGDGAD